MNYIQTEIDGVWLIEPRVFSDERGYFMEAYKKEEFEANIGPVNFIQDNESKSSFGVLRGLHYQKGEHSQAKLVRVLKGEVLDVAVDLRKSSPTFGKHVCVLLSEENKRQFFIPRGFAMLSRREVSLGQNFVCAEDWFTKTACNFRFRTYISSHNIKKML